MALLLPIDAISFSRLTLGGEKLAVAQPEINGKTPNTVSNLRCMNTPCPEI